MYILGVLQRFPIPFRASSACAAWSQQLWTASHTFCITFVFQFPWTFISVFVVLYVALELFQEEEEKSSGLCTSDLKSVGTLTELLGRGASDSEGSCANGQGPSCAHVWTRWCFWLITVSSAGLWDTRWTRWAVSLLYGFGAQGKRWGMRGKDHYYFIAASAIYWELALFPGVYESYLVQFQQENRLREVKSSC